MGPTARFTELVDASATDVPLDVGALCIAAHARPGVDFEAFTSTWLRRLDEIAAACHAPTFAAVREHLFVDSGFRGNTERYDDPDNSFLDAVIARRRGIPITLAIVLIEVARRLGVALLPVGMPGHFLVRVDDDAFCDPFHGGAMLDREGCRAVFDAVFRGSRMFDPEADLRPTPARLVLARMLANLEQGPLARDPAHLLWLCELHLAIPGISLAEHVALAQRLARVADPVRAAQAYDDAAERAGEAVGDRLRAESRRLRARLN